MSLTKMVCGVNYNTEVLKYNVNGLIDGNDRLSSTKTSGLYNLGSSSPVRMCFGIDSLTAGAGGDSYLNFLRDKIWSYYGDRGGYYSLSVEQANFAGASFGQSGFDDIETLDVTTAPAIYSFNFQGLHTDSFTSAKYIDWDPQRLYSTVKIFYLQQPSGGSFKYGHTSVDKASHVTVSTNGTLSIQSVTIPYDATTTGGVSISHATDGVMTIFGVLVEASDGVSVIKQALGGKKVEDFARLTLLNQWYAALSPDLFIFNGGMNDRLTRAAGQILSDYQSAFAANLPASCDVIMVSPNQPADFDSSSLVTLEAAIESYAKDNNHGYIRISDYLGDYNSAVDWGMMLDGVHPNTRANRYLADKIADYLNIPRGFGAFTQRPYLSVADVYQRTGDLSTNNTILTRGSSQVVYTLGLTNAYPAAVFDIVVVAQRQGSASIVKTVHRLSISNYTVIGNATEVSAVVSTDEQFRTTSGDGNTHNHTVTAAIVDNKCEITLTSNATDNAAVTEQIYTVTGSYVFGNLYTKGTSVYEY